MGQLRVDPVALEALARRLVGLRREFGTLEHRMEDYEAAVGHRRVVEALHDLATNWSDAKAKISGEMEGLANMVAGAAAVYHEQETELAAGIAEATDRRAAGR
jgi:hypothetical protein